MLPYSVTESSKPREVRIPMDGTRYVRYGDTVGSYLLSLDYHKVNFFFTFFTFYLGTLAYLIFLVLMDDDDDGVC